MAPRKSGAAATGPPPRRSSRIAEQESRKAPSKPFKIIKTSKPKPVKRECVSCSRRLALSSFPSQLAAGKCTHAVNTCKQCASSWVAAQIDSLTYDNISCPECPELLVNADVERLAIMAVYKRFDFLERRGIADKIPGWRWCLNPRCREGQVHEPLAKIKIDSAGDENIQNVEPPIDSWTLNVPSPISSAVTSEMKKDTIDQDHVCICHGCGAEACVRCDRPYHRGETCEQYQERRKRQTEADEEATKQTIQEKCKKCPNPQCEKNIEKKGGCDAVRCTQCFTHFCYRCVRPYTEINKSGHAAGCVYTAVGAFDPHAAPDAPNGLGVVGNLQGQGLFGGQVQQADPMQLGGQGLFGGQVQQAVPIQLGGQRLVGVQQQQDGPVQLGGQGLVGVQQQQDGPVRPDGPIVPDGQRPGAVPGLVQGALVGAVQRPPPALLPLGFPFHGGRGRRGRHRN